MEIVSYGLVAVASVIVGFHTVMWMHRKFREDEKAYEAEMLSLTDAQVRARLSQFLVKNGITGSAEVREGLVLPLKEADAHPLATVFGNAVEFANRLQNPAATPIYIRDSVQGRYLLLCDLDIDHIREAAEMLRRVAEEKRK